MATSFEFRTISALASILALLACSSTGTSPGTSDPDASKPEGPSQAVTATEEIPASLQEALHAAASLDGTGIAAAYPVPVTAPLGYDPSAAVGMDLIQASSLALNGNELSKLTENGFVITKRKTFPSFAYGYKSIYAEDLPVYVSADSILEAVHRTFDALLSQTEERVLVDELSTLLTGMRAALASAEMDAGVMKDADLYLGLAASLLGGKLVTPVAGADPAELSSLFALATKASGHQMVKLFGVNRDEDFSQFAPRGHYANSEQLKLYFKAMMWLGRVDLRLVETQGDGSQLFYRRQFDAAVALRQLMTDSGFKLWQHIDETIGAFVGEHDSMTPKDLDALMASLNVTSLADSAQLTDQQIVDEIARGGWGAQRIASRIIVKNDPSATTLPLDRSFMLFGQRFTVDSYTFVNVTFDRVKGRMMPKPLDVAFAALGNNAALPLLASEFDNTSYVAGLAKTRTLIDAHESAYWDGSIYTRWLGTLRSLAPQENTQLPTIAKTTAWQSRMLSAQLASWAELRRDTILYVKQSYTGGVSCVFPDAYVDPYPEFYAKLGGLAAAVGTVASSLPDAAADLKASIQSWVTTFGLVTTNLQKMAENQLAGTAHAQQLLDFINDAVKWDESRICGDVVRTNLAGWYLNLYLNRYPGFEFDPVVADVHTQPTDAAGNDVGRILHVGTGAPRLMVVTADSCQGPRAYVGLASSYGELITEKWERLNDSEWATTISQAPFPDAPWMNPLLSE